MVVLYVRGNRVGTVEQDPQLLARLIESGQPVEFRNDAGKNLGRVVHEWGPDEPICPWDPELTEEEIQRQNQEPGAMTLAEFWRQIGAK
jgi:hypothetical protein